ncbi:MAG: shikimate dehydrogenase [Phycisphaerae bacterium]|nr:shikimate dehydrogenase [Phycisphaerae bacterium]
MTFLCASLTPHSSNEATEQLAKVAPLVDLAEVRTDYMAECDLKRLLHGRPCPVIITNRPERQGGRCAASEAERVARLNEAVRLGADYVDIELDAVSMLADRSGSRTRMIVSHHDFSKTPADLAGILRDIAATGADVAKIAVMATDIVDNVAVLGLLRQPSCPTIAIAMGEKGLVSRVLAPKFEGYLTFAALDPDEDTPPAGPGQLSVSTMRHLYRFGHIGPETACYGVVGNPVGHSMSPAIHNAAFAECGIDAVYLPLLVECDPAVFIRAFRDLDFSGYSVTIPHKQTSMPALDEIEPVARRIGAINTVVRRSGGVLFGTNTDWTAGMASIVASLPDPDWLRGKRAMLLGSGGLGRAMAFGLREYGADVTITDIDPIRAETLARDVGVAAIRIEQIEEQKPDVILNCSPVGMHPKTDASPVPESMLREGLVVYDAVYNPIETLLVRQAKAAGAITVSGIDHFVGQAVEQFQLWTGRDAPVDLMRQVCLDALTAKK